MKWKLCIWSNNTSYLYENIPHNKYVPLRNAKMLVLNFTNIEQIRIYLFKAAIKFIQVPFYAYQAAAISFFSVDWILLCCLQNCHFCNYFLLQKQLFDEMMQQPINNYHLYISLKITNFFYIFLLLFQSTRKKFQSTLVWMLNDVKRKVYSYDLWPDIISYFLSHPTKNGSAKGYKED